MIAINHHMLGAGYALLKLLSYEINRSYTKFVQSKDQNRRSIFWYHMYVAQCNELPAPIANAKKIHPFRHDTGYSVKNSKAFITSAAPTKRFVSVFDERPAALVGI